MSEAEPTIQKPTKNEIWDAAEIAVSETESLGRVQLFLDCDRMRKKAKITVESMFKAGQQMLTPEYGPRAIPLTAIYSSELGRKNEREDVVAAVDKIEAALEMEWELYVGTFHRRGLTNWTTI